MKKLFFLFGFVVVLSFGAKAQDYYMVPDAVDQLKEAYAEISTETVKMDATMDSANKLQAAKRTAVKLLLIAIPEDGNNQQTLNAVLSHDRFNTIGLSDAKMTELSDYLTGLLTKS